MGWRGASFVYQRLQLAINVSAVDRRTFVRLAPRLAWTLVARLQARGERIEAGPGGGRPAVAAPPLPGTVAMGREAPQGQPRIPYLPPVTRIVHKLQEEPSPVVRRPSSVVPATQEWQSEATPQRERTHAPPPVDVNRLTDQVIQAIDHRIIAERERRGGL
jgi:hypothetical protein